MYNEHISLETYHLRSYLTDIFTVLSFEELEQVSSGGMVWMLDERIWTWPYAYSGASDQKTLLNRATGFSHGIGI